jgi:uncharacterized membrane protein YphA (DoxX/SURF4 family)
MEVSMKRARAVALWIVTILVAMVMIGPGVQKFTSPVWQRMCRVWGYPEHFYLLIGVIEVVAGIGLLVPRVAGASAITLMAVMAGAFVTQVTHGRSGIGELVFMRWPIIGPDATESGALVPPLILQPLVENSIRHGLPARVTAGRIRVRAMRRADRLVLEVQDDGAGLEPHGSTREGVGLGNTRARLQQLHGQAHSVEIRNADGGGTLVRLTMPWQRDNYVTLHAGAERFVARETMGRLDRELDPERFVRIHRSVIVQVDRIKELLPDFHGDFTVVLRNGARVTLSRTYRAKVEQVLGREL